MSNYDEETVQSVKNAILHIFERLNVSYSEARAIVFSIATEIEYRDGYRTAANYVENMFKNADAVKSATAHNEMYQ